MMFEGVLATRGGVGVNPPQGRRLVVLEVYAGLLSHDGHLHP